MVGAVDKVARGESSRAPALIQSLTFATSVVASSAPPRGIEGFIAPLMYFTVRLSSGLPGRNAGPRFPPLRNPSKVVRSSPDDFDAGWWQPAQYFCRIGRTSAV